MFNEEIGDGTPISNMNIQEFIKKLHPIEIKVLLLLESGVTNSKQISENTGLPIDSIIWAFELLKEKGLILLDEKVYVEYDLDTEGKLYVENLFPEQRIVKKLADLGGEATIEELHLTEDEIKIGLSWAIKLGFISIERRDEKRVLKLKIGGVEILENYPPYILLNKIKYRKSLSKDDLEILNELMRRGPLIKIIKHKELNAHLSDKGFNVVNEIKKTLLTIEKSMDLKNLKIVNELTRELITSGEWMTAYFRPYDVSAPVKKLYFGRKHPYREIIDEIREILIGLGFEEVTSPPIEVNFWNSDVLFMPSDHPARDIHDVFYLDYKPMSIERVANREIWLRVKATHENGWETGSRGWGFWDPELALKRILRSQTTSLSVRYLSQLREEDLPKKMFTIDRNYRPDRIDATHLMEFNQCEGIVVAKDVNFKHLLGFLKTIAEAFGIKDVKFQPAYFPFTEPSVVGYVKHEKLGWMEALPAGIFRPEVTYPLGIKVPVLAWGLGIDRLAMVALKIEDIRLLFSNDLDWLRSQKIPSIWRI